MKQFITTLLFLIGINAFSNSLFPANADHRNLPETPVTIEKHNALVRAVFVLDQLLSNDTAASVVLGYTARMRSVNVYYFPGTSGQNALILGGVHGSELSAIEVANKVVTQLQSGKKPYYNTIVIPCLFPDNAAVAENNKPEIGSTSNVGRYTNGFTADPNRQMPALGTPFSESDALDVAGRNIEWENQLLLQLIQIYQPERIASLHAIRNALCAGVFADPRTGCSGIAHGFEPDSLLAIQLASQIQHFGGAAPGNQLHSKPSAVYYCDPKIAGKGEKQLRNLHGSQLPGNRGYGVSLGSWASTDVCDENDSLQRKAAIMLTIEFPGNKRPQDCEGKEQLQCLKNTTAYARAISEVFVQHPL